MTENPGVTFTRNIDNKFVATVKDLLRDGRDMSVQQILRETLDNFQYSRGEDETLKPLMTMWSEYKAKMAKKGGYNADIVSWQSDVQNCTCTNHMQRALRNPALRNPDPRSILTLQSKTNIKDTEGQRPCPHSTSLPRASKRPEHPPSCLHKWSSPHQAQKSLATTSSRNSRSAARQHPARSRASLPPKIRRRTPTPRSL